MDFMTAQEFVTQVLQQQLPADRSRAAISPWVAQMSVSTFTRYYWMMKWNEHVRDNQFPSLWMVY